MIHFLTASMIAGSIACSTTSSHPIAENTCGPQTLSRVLQHFGIAATEDDVAKRAETDGKGTTLLGLKKAAESFGVKADGVRLTLFELQEELASNVQVIAFVNNNHFLWVHQIGKDQVETEEGNGTRKNIPIKAWQSMWLQNAAAQDSSSQGICLLIQ